MKLLGSKQINLSRAGFFVVLGSAFAVVGCSDIQHESQPKQDFVQQSQQSSPSPSPSVPAVSRPATVMAYRLAANPDEQKQADANGLVPVPVIVPAGDQDTAKIAVMSLTAGPGSPLPLGTKLVGINIDSASKLATVNFSHEFKTNFRGGETRESQAIESVLQTLGQFPTVNKVQFLVDGRRIDTLGGSQDLDQPLPTPQSGQTLADSSAKA